MVRTFKNIISDIEDFCSSHAQIHDFGWGQLSNITTKDHDFTMVWLQPTGTRIDGHLIVMEMDMYVFDLLKQDKSNLLDVMNDTLLIGNDVVSKFWDDEETYEWTLNEEGVTSEPFEARFDDYIGGWVFGIEIEIENRMNLCAVPSGLTSSTPVPSKTLLVTDMTTGQSPISFGVGYVEGVFGTIEPDLSAIKQILSLSEPIEYQELRIIVHDDEGVPVESIDYIKINGTEYTGFTWNGIYLYKETTQYQIFRVGRSYEIEIEY